MNYCEIDSAKIACKLFGNGTRTLVIDTGLGSCSAEWWHIAEALSVKYRVLVYDRAGYGKSSMSTLERKPRNIAAELNKLLYAAGVEGNIIIIGHSQGGLNAIEYALLYPKNVTGLVLLDPATPFDREFKRNLTAEEYKKSGIDKTFTYKAGLIITTMGLGFILKPLFKNAPPFYYYNFPRTSKKYLLKALCKRNTYKTALAEYESTHNGKDTEDIEKAIQNSSLENIPVKLITHSSDIYIKELEYFGGLDTETAQKVESMWQDLMKRYLSLSSNTEHVIAPKSGHFIHLTDFEVLKNTIDRLNF